MHIMNRKIAVEQNLTQVKNFHAKGYFVDSINFGREFSRDLDEYDAVVVTDSSDSRNFTCPCTDNAYHCQVA